MNECNEGPSAAAGAAPEADAFHAAPTFFTPLMSSFAVPASGSTTPSPEMVCPNALSSPPKRHSQTRSHSSGADAQESSSTEVTNACARRDSFSFVTTCLASTSTSRVPLKAMPQFQTSATSTSSTSRGVREGGGGVVATQGNPPKEATGSTGEARDGLKRGSVAVKLPLPPARAGHVPCTQHNDVILYSVSAVSLLGSEQQFPFSRVRGAAEMCALERPRPDEETRGEDSAAEAMAQPRSAASVLPRYNVRPMVPSQHVKGYLAKLQQAHAPRYLREPVLQTGRASTASNDHAMLPMCRPPSPPPRHRRPHVDVARAKEDALVAQPLPRDTASHAGAAPPLRPQTQQHTATGVVTLPSSSSGLWAALIARDECVQREAIVWEETMAAVRTIPYPLHSPTVTEVSVYKESEVGQMEVCLPLLQHPALVWGVQHLIWQEEIQRAGVLCEEEETFTERLMKPLRHAKRVLRVGTLPLERFLREWIAQYRARCVFQKKQREHLAQQEDRRRRDLEYCSALAEERDALFRDVLCAEEAMYRYQLEDLQLRAQCLSDAVRIRLEEHVARYDVCFGRAMSRAWVCGNVSGVTAFSCIARLEEYRRRCLFEEEQCAYVTEAAQVEMDSLVRLFEPLARREVEVDQEAARAELQYRVYTLVVHYTLRDVEVQEAVARGLLLPRLPPHNSEGCTKGTLRTTEECASLNETEPQQRPIAMQ